MLDNSEGGDSVICYECGRVGMADQLPAITVVKIRCRREICQAHERILEIGGLLPQCRTHQMSSIHAAVRGDPQAVISWPVFLTLCLRYTTNAQLECCPDDRPAYFPPSLSGAGGPG